MPEALRHKLNLNTKEAWSLSNAEAIAAVMGFICDDNFRSNLAWFIQRHVSTASICSTLQACFQGILTDSRQPLKLQRLPRSLDTMTMGRGYQERHTNHRSHSIAHFFPRLVQLLHTKPLIRKKT